MKLPLRSFRSNLRLNLYITAIKNAARGITNISARLCSEKFQRNDVVIASLRLYIRSDLYFRFRITLPRLAATGADNQLTIKKRVQHSAWQTNRTVSKLIARGAVARNIELLLFHRSEVNALSDYPLKWNIKYASRLRIASLALPTCTSREDRD